MTLPTYFDSVPTIKYAMQINKAGVGSYVELKDFWRLMRMRDDIFAEDTLYYDYVVNNGERPEQISFKEYGDERFYWVILQINDITDFWSQWPLDQVELEKYIDNKYGNQADEIHHYVTERVLDDSGNVLLEGGLVVPENYIYYYRTSITSNITLSSFPVPVTNRQYEWDENDKKLNIQLIKPDKIYRFEREWTNYTRRLQNGESETYIP